MSLLLVPLALACPSLDDALARAEAALGTDPVAVDAALAEAAEALGCAPVHREVLGSYWALEARRRVAAGEVDRAALAAQAAGRLLAPDSPPLAGLPDPAADDGPGWLLVDTNRATTHVDGAVPHAWPAELPSGLHLVQVHAPDGATVWYGRVVRVAAGEEVVVETGLAEAELPSLPAPPPLDAPARPRRPVGFLVAGGATAAGAGALYALAALEHRAYAEGDTPAELGDTWNRQRAFAGGAFALSALSAGAVVAYVVF